MIKLNMRTRGFRRPPGSARESFGGGDRLRPEKVLPRGGLVLPRTCDFISGRREFARMIFEGVLEAFQGIFKASWILKKSKGFFFLDFSRAPTQIQKKRFFLTFLNLDPVRCLSGPWTALGKWNQTIFRCI